MTIPVPTTTLAIFGLPGHWEAIVLLALGVLIFGRRLPEVGRSMGRGIVEFKKGLKGIEDDLEEASNPTSPQQSTPSAQSSGGTLPGGNAQNSGSTVNTGAPVGAQSGGTGSS
jgi:sec-independent protein translocase protein TatA